MRRLTLPIRGFGASKVLTSQSPGAGRFTESSPASFYGVALGRKIPIALWRLVL